MALSAKKKKRKDGSGCLQYKNGPHKKGKERKQTGQSRDEAKEGDEEGGKGLSVGLKGQEDIGPASQSSKASNVCFLSYLQMKFSYRHYIFKLKYYFDI